MYAYIKKTKSNQPTRHNISQHRPARICTTVLVLRLDPNPGKILSCWLYLHSKKRKVKKKEPAIISDVKHPLNVEEDLKADVLRLPVYLKTDKDVPFLYSVICIYCHFYLISLFQNKINSLFKILWQTGTV